MIKDGKVVKTIMHDFHLAEISGVDQPAQVGARVALIKRGGPGLEGPERRGGPEVADPGLQKMALAMTTETDGHAHLLVVESGWEIRRAGTTDYVNEHSHSWIMGEDGNILIGASKGHTHDIAMAVKREFSGKEREKAAEAGTAMPDGSFPIKTKQDLKNAISAFGRAKPADRAAVARHIRRRAKALDATDLLPTSGTLAAALGKADDAGGSEGNNMDEKEIQKMKDDLAALQKRAEKAEALAALPESHRAFHKGLKGEASDAFLKATVEEREEQIRKAAEVNVVVYKATDGTEYRKADDPRLVALAKRADEERKARTEAEAVAKRADLEKRAGEFAHLPGDLETRINLLKAVDALPEADKGKALQALKAQDAALGAAFKTLGTRAPGAEGEDQLDKLAKTIQERDKISFEQAMDKALQTPEGVALFEKHYRPKPLQV